MMTDYTHLIAQCTAALTALKETCEADIVCSDCGGAGWWWAEGKGPSYVISTGDPPRHKVACESCGGNVDQPGTGRREDVTLSTWLTASIERDLAALREHEAAEREYAPRLAYHYEHREDVWTNADDRLGAATAVHRRATDRLAASLRAQGLLTEGVGE